MTLKICSRQVLYLNHPQKKTLTWPQQCIIPCLEGLRPEPHNTTVLDLIFLLATWHALAKMNIQTDTSLRLLNTATTALGNGLRYFVGVTCLEFNTVETSAEFSKQRRRQTANMPQKPSEPTGRQPKTLSLKTIKLHFLGDYVWCIRIFGSTDNYTSGLICSSFICYLLHWGTL